jgi:hypothetical protein
MLTVKDLVNTIDQCIKQGTITGDSEVRILTKPSCHLEGDLDCSIDQTTTTMKAGFSDSGEPLDRRFGEGVFVLGLEDVLRPAPQETLKQLDWKF